MSGELTLSQFRWTVTNNNDFVIGDPSDATDAARMLVFQTTADPGYENNPHIGVTKVGPDWKFRFSENGADQLALILDGANNTFSGNNIFSGDNTFSGANIFSGGAQFTSPVALDTNVTITGTYLTVNSPTTFTDSIITQNPVTIQDDIEFTAGAPITVRGNATFENTGATRFNSAVSLYGTNTFHGAATFNAYATFENNAYHNAPAFFGAATVFNTNAPVTFNKDITIAATAPITSAASITQSGASAFNGTTSFGSSVYFSGTPVFSSGATLSTGGSLTVNVGSTFNGTVALNGAVNIADNHINLNVGNSLAAGQNAGIYVIRDLGAAVGSIYLNHTGTPPTWEFKTPTGGAIAISPPQSYSNAWWRIQEDTDSIRAGQDFHLPTTFAVNSSSLLACFKDITSVSDLLDSGQGNKVVAVNGTTGFLGTTDATISDMTYIAGIAGNTGTLYGALSGKAATSHAHVISDITNLQSELNSKASTSHVHLPGNVSLYRNDLASPVDGGSLNVDGVWDIADYFTYQISNDTYSCIKTCLVQVNGTFSHVGTDTDAGGGGWYKICQKIYINTSEKGPSAYAGGATENGRDGPSGGVTWVGTVLAGQTLRLRTYKHSESAWIPEKTSICWSIIAWPYT